MSSRDAQSFADPPARTMSYSRIDTSICAHLAGLLARAPEEVGVAKVESGQDSELLALLLELTSKPWRLAWRFIVPCIGG